jgi:uncharacterized protein (TIGR04255 family)
MNFMRKIMPFPETQRVIYQKNPLDQVICQLRFPPILKIDTEIPAIFQEKIRKDFPNFTETKLEIPLNATGKIPIDISSILQSSGTKNHEFSSEDGSWKINLTRTFLAITSNDYSRWENFVDKINLPLSALIEVYSPGYFSRVGLRYINIIKRSSLDLDNVDWNDLIKPYILGILGSTNVGKNVKNFENKYEIVLSDKKSIVRIVTKFVVAKDNGETCYSIDSDFFNTSRTDIDNVMQILNFFNSRGSRLIQWCITNRLHEAMKPQEL